MYSSEFRKWCNRYLQGSDIKIRSGAQKTELLSGLLNNCAYCDMEASENELRIICGNVDLYGIDATMAMVAMAAMAVRSGPRLSRD